MITKRLHARRMLKAGQLGITQAEDRAASAALRAYAEHPGPEARANAEAAIQRLPISIQTALKQAARV